MVGPSFIDEIDCGNFFDHIDDLIVFPEEANSSNNENGFVGGESVGAFPSLWAEPTELFPGSESVLSGTKTSPLSDLSAELSLPYEDIVQMEWLSNFVEDSFSGGDSMTMDKENTSVNKLDSSGNQLFLSTSPISVLESSSPCSVASKTLSLSPEIGLAPTCRGRARSKRPRPPTFNPRPAVQLMPAPIPLSATTKVVSESESIAESSPLMMISIPEQKKKKKMKMQMPTRAGENVQNQDENHNENTPPAQAAVRKCLHCEITKTPQWRLGPMGPKTLCNACGVRYKSGRLYPEYRPAASPTFVPSLHSNSHKKVLEMRNKVDDPNPVSIKTAIASAQSELIPNISPLVDYV